MSVLRIIYSVNPHKQFRIHVHTFMYIFNYFQKMVITQGEMKFKSQLALWVSCNFIFLAQVSEELAQNYFI